MDLEQLREFIVLAEHLNYSEAAKQLYIAQPVLSRHIADLERQLGVQLFLRNRHSVQLTAIGSLVLEESKAVLARYEEALQKIQLAASGFAGSLTIGFLDRAVKGILAQFVMHFRPIYPHIHLDLYSFDMDELTQALRNGKIDIAFTLALGLDNTMGFSKRTIYRDVLCAAVRHDHPLAGRSDIPLSSLADEPLIMLNREQFSNAISHSIELFKARGLAPKIVKETARIDTALLLVEVGMGVLILPRHHFTYANPNVCFINIEDAGSHIDVVMAWKTANSNPAIPPFVKEFDTISPDLLLQPRL